MLEVLDISSTHLQKVGAAKVFNAITNNKCLRVLNASHNQVGDDAIDNLICSLSNNVALQDIRLYGNPISEKAIEQFVCKILLLNIKSLGHIKVPCINDDDIKSEIATQNKRVNSGRIANTQLKLFTW